MRVGVLRHVVRQRRVANAYHVVIATASDGSVKQKNGNQVAYLVGKARDDELRQVGVAGITLVLQNRPQIVRRNKPDLDKVHGKVCHVGTPHIAKPGEVSGGERLIQTSNLLPSEVSAMAQELIAAVMASRLGIGFDTLLHR